MNRRFIYICAVLLSASFESCAVDEPLGWAVNSESCIVEDLGSSQGTSITIDLNNVDASDNVIQSFRESQLKCIERHVKAASYQDCKWQWDTNDNFSEDISLLKELEPFQLTPESKAQLMKDKDLEQKACLASKDFCNQEGVKCILSADDLLELKDIMGKEPTGQLCGPASQRQNIYIFNDITIDAEVMLKLEEAGITSLYNLSIQSVPGANPSTLTLEGIAETLFKSINNVAMNKINVVMHPSAEADMENRVARLARDVKCSEFNEVTFEVSQAEEALFESVTDSQILSSRFNVTAEGDQVHALISDKIEHSKMSDVVIKGSLINGAEADCEGLEEIEENGRKELIHTEAHAPLLGIGTLAGRVVNSEIHNVILDQISIEATRQCVVGGLIGYAENVQVTYDQNAENNRSIKLDYAEEVLGKNWVGGRIGYLHSGNIHALNAETGIRHLSKTGRVQGHYDVGGFVGYASKDAVIRGIKNEVGTVNGDKENIGGFIGHMQGMAENIMNLVEVVNQWEEESHWTGAYQLDCSDASYISKLDKGDTHSCLHTHSKETVGMYLYQANKVGGFVGYLDEHGWLENIQNRVKRVIGWDSVAGLVGGTSRFGYILRAANQVTDRISGHVSVGGLIGNNEGRVNEIHNQVNNVYGIADTGGAIGYSTNTGNIKELLNEANLVTCAMLCGGGIGESDGTIDTVKSQVNRVNANAYAGGFSANVSGIVEDVYASANGIEGLRCSNVTQDKKGVQDTCCTVEDVTFCRSIAVDGGERESGEVVRLYNLCKDKDENQDSRLTCKLGGFAAIGDSSVYGPSLINITMHFGEVKGDYDLGGLLSYQAFNRATSMPRIIMYDNIAISGNIQLTSDLNIENTAGFVGSLISINAESFSYLVTFKIHLVSSMIKIKDQKGNVLEGSPFIGSFMFSKSPTDRSAFIRETLKNAFWIASETTPVVYTACSSKACLPIYDWANVTGKLRNSIYIFNDQSSNAEFDNAVKSYNKIVNEGWSTLRPVDWKIGDAKLCKPYAQCLTFDSVSDHLNVPEFEQDIISQ